jgi:hypothetical protein
MQRKINFIKKNCPAVKHLGHKQQEKLAYSIKDETLSRD